MIQTDFLPIINAHAKEMRELKIIKKRQIKNNIVDAIGAISIFVCIFGLYFIGCCF